jgi:hypothetical protein
MAEKSHYGCEVPGCLAHVDHGDAIHRTSPKGGPFRGKCTPHFRAAGGEPDDIAVIIEEHNQGSRVPQEPPGEDKKVQK